MRGMRYSLLLLILVAFSGCKETKDDCLTDFKSFVNEVRRDGHLYTDIEWKEAHQNFDRLVNTLYGKFGKQLTDFDRVEISKLKGRYTALKIKGETRKSEKKEQQLLRQHNFASTNDAGKGG